MKLEADSPKLSIDRRVSFRKRIMFLCITARLPLPDCLMLGLL